MKVIDVFVLIIVEIMQRCQVSLQAQTNGTFCRLTVSGPQCIIVAEKNS